MNNKNEWLWTEKYRPRDLNFCILPANIKSELTSFILLRKIPNMIFTGPSGAGKTTAALAMFDMLDSDYLKINASKENGIDIIRSKMQDFASTMSFNCERKYILLDEADGLSASAQDALKGFIEEFSAHCGFILTCNDLGKIIPQLQSRCQPIMDFSLTKENFKDLGAEFFHSLQTILKAENVEYVPVALAGVIKKYYPDWRATLSVIQAYSIKSMKIDNGILVKKPSLAAYVVHFLKKKDWTGMRTYIGEHFFQLGTFSAFARDLLRELEDLIDDKSKAILIMTIAEFGYKDYFMADKEINLMAFLTNVITDVTFK